MTVKETIEKLKNLDENLDLFVQVNGQLYDYMMVETLRTKFLMLEEGEDEEQVVVVEYE